MTNIQDFRDYSLAFNQANWKRTRKKKYRVYVCMPMLGTKVYNFLENANYITSEQKPFVLSGTVGEQWVIDAKKLFRTYQLLTGEPLNYDFLKSKGHPYRIDWFEIETRPDVVKKWALFVPKSKKLAVSTSWGDVLIANNNGVHHGLGDYLVCADSNGVPNLQDVWVVNGNIFPATYDIRGFKII